MNTAERLLDAYNRFIDVLMEAVRIVTLVFTVAFFIIVITTVFTRYLGDFVFSWSEEVPRYLLVWVTFLGGALAADRGDHIGFDYLYNLLPAPVRVPLRFVLNVGIVVFGVVMLNAGIDFVQQFGGDWMESIPFRNYWFYPALPVSGVLIVLVVLRQELNSLRDNLRHGAEGTPPQPPPA